MHEPALVMIHGLVGSLHYFDPQSRVAHATVLNVDLLGYGARRHVPPDRLTLDAQAEHVIGFLETLGDENLWLLGHSMGGAVAMLAADRRPARLRGIINVEGNFTRPDTFWSQKIIQQRPDQWAESYRRMCDRVPETLERWGVSATPQRLHWAAHILNHQPAGTVHAMARALVEETAPPAYLEAIRRVVERVPVHLLAGERSADAWGVPDFVRAAAASDHVQAEAGHLMMLERPDAFCAIVDSIIAQG